MDREKMIILVTKAQCGDSDATEKCLQLVYPSVTYQCKKILKNADYEDLVQETLLAIYQKLDTLENPAAFTSWANRIAAMRCINYVNRHPREFQFVEYEDGSSSEEFIEELDKQKIPDAKVDSAETSKMVQKLIDRLPDAQRISVYLYYYDGFSVRQIAKLMQTTENTVKSRLNYARKALKEGVLDYERKDGVKLYSLSPVPFLLYFMRQMAASSADPVAAKAAAQVIVSGSAATVTAGSPVTESARSNGKYAKSSHTKAAKSAPAGKAATKTSGALSGMATKIAAGVAAVAVTVGGVGIAVSSTSGNEATEPAGTQTYAVTESMTIQRDIVAETVAPEIETAEPTEATIAAEPFTILRTTIDTTGYDCEMYLETPEFAVASAGYKKINQFFADMRDAYLNGEDEQVGFMFDRMAQGTGEGTYSYTQTCTVRCQTEHFASVSYAIFWFVSSTNVSYVNYTFDTQTGELLELTDLINGTEQEIVEYIISLYDAEGYNEESYIYLPTDISSYIFYVENNHLFVRANGDMVSTLVPYIEIPGELL